MLYSVSIDLYARLFIYLASPRPRRGTAPPASIDPKSSAHPCALHAPLVAHVKILLMWHVPRNGKAHAKVGSEYCQQDDNLPRVCCGFDMAASTNYSHTMPPKRRVSPSLSHALRATAGGIFLRRSATLFWQHFRIFRPLPHGHSQCCLRLSLLRIRKNR